MTDSPSIIPSRELVYQWLAEVWHEGTPVRVAASDEYLATCAARWGANQELEACCDLLPGLTSYLREERRPQSLNLKEQALKELAWVDKNLKVGFFGHCDAIHTIRRALEQLPND